MSLEKITAQLGKLADGKSSKIPPVELWDPPYCGEMDIVIKADGSWFYNGTIFKRMRLVKLLASVLKKEDNEYFLVTPVEKIKITVEDAPLVLTKWEWLDVAETQMAVCTHLDDEFVLNSEHPLRLDEQGNMFVTVRRNLEAKVHRNVYYQWVELAKEVTTSKGTEMMFTSADCDFSLGCI
jgi:hypothetical protein